MNICLRAYLHYIGSNVSIHVPFADDEKLETNVVNAT